MSEVPLYGTDKTVAARFWPWLSGQSLGNLSRFSLFARKRSGFRVWGGTPMTMLTASSIGL